jgi:carboxypeptidase C (cathepsin A)
LFPSQIQSHFSGFSFTGKDDCYAKTEEDVASDLYDALQQFFTLFPDLRTKNEFYVSGESYAGKYVPAITYKIHTMNEATKDADKHINLKVIGLRITIQGKYFTA